jgi:hypothetical protein
MSFMAERPTGALRGEEEEPPPDDGSVDIASEADPDADAPAGWTATHYTAGGGEAEDDAGNLVTVDPDGTVQTFMASETGIAVPTRSASDAVGRADQGEWELDVDIEE